jgi:hypothetical protein
MNYDLDQLDEELRIKQRGSNGKTHPAHHGKKTNNAIAQDIVANSHDHKKHEVEKKLFKVIDNFPLYHGNEDLINKYENRYIEWVKTCLNERKLILRDQDIDEDFFKASSSGGQNVNARGTAVRLKHRITNIQIENEEERNQFQNKENAIEHLKVKLIEHLKDWTTYLEGKNPQELTRYDLTDIIKKQTQEEDL